MHISIFTNTQKSQFRQVKDGVWQILGIPITVDNAVMNGVYYDKEENAKGLHTYKGKPVVLRHPVDDKGNGLSAISAKGLMDHFSGGVIINTYNHNGVNYADAEFKEKMMRGQDNGDYYADKLKNGEEIGISTGLWFDDNNSCGETENGEYYYARAINQLADHIAMLPEGEDPAGGKDTMIRFNSDIPEKVLHVNIDKFLSEKKEVDELIVREFAKNEEERGVISRLLALFNRKLALHEQNDDNVNDLNINTSEGDAMRKTVEDELQQRGIAFNKDATDAELLSLLNKSNMPDVTAAVNAAFAPLKEQFETMTATFTANAEKELTDAATQAAEILGVEVDEAKQMGLNALHKVLAKNGVIVGAPNATNHQSPKDQPKCDINMEPWNDKEAK